MNRIPLLLAVALAACNGAVLPVAQDSDQDGGGTASDAGQPSQDGGGLDSTTPSPDGGSSTCGGEVGFSCACGQPVCVGGQPGCTPCSDGGGTTCPADAGGNSCLCGDLVCVNDQWTCGPCNVDAGPPSGCSPSCTGSQVCVRDLILGGPLVLSEQGPDGGPVGPTGYHVNATAPSQCERDPSFACIETPAACVGQGLSCACGDVVCSSQNSCPYRCTGATTNEIDCECDVP
jgi:hypothetical protein